MRIGIDCDGVLRDLIGHLINNVKENNPQYADQILVPESWDWSDWLPFWTDEEAEEYIFEKHFETLFGTDCPPIQSSVDDWKDLKEWAKENDHELVLVSAQRKQCIEPTKKWLEKYGFDFDEMHFTHQKWSVDVDVLIDDSPKKLGMFKKKSVVNGTPIVYRQTWNKKSQRSKMTIDRLSDLTTRVFG